MSALDMPEGWARCNVAAYHSKSAAYADGFRKGWDAAFARLPHLNGAQIADLRKPGVTLVRLPESEGSEP